MSGGPRKLHSARLLRRRLVGGHTLELIFTRPEGFRFSAGQSIRIVEAGIERDYSIASGSSDPDLAILARIVPGGTMTGLLASAEPGRLFHFEGPRGFFTIQSPGMPVVFVATGTGAAPFLSMARSSVAAGFTMLHGVRRVEELLYPDELRGAASRFVPCISREAAGDCFPGRVTECAQQLPDPGPFDFYLCGGSDMIGEMSLLIDRRFPGSLVHTETFY
jgi:ferredoxin-NADP reductase